MPADISQLTALARDLNLAGPKPAAAMGAQVSATAQRIAESARGAAPVRTGQLRSTIAASGRGLSATVEVGSEYAQFVEYGTARTAPQPFLMPAADQGEDLLAAAAEIAAGEVLD